MLANNPLDEQIRIDGYDDYCNKCHLDRKNLSNNHAKKRIVVMKEASDRTSDAFITLQR